MKIRSMVALATLAVLLPVTGAVENRVWVREGDTFRVGQLEGMLVSPDGRMMPGPERVELGRPAEAVLWDGAFLGEDLLVAAGAPARVLRYGKGGGAPVERFLPGGGQAFAVAVGRRGEVFAASGPEGAVYRLDMAKGKVEEIFRPEAEYIWDLAVEGNGNLLVATGLPGAVYEIDPRGKKVTTLWESRDPHVRCLAVDGETVLAGTVGSGLLVRLDGKGRAYVLWDSNRPETSALAVGAQGTIWAAFTGTPGKAESGGTGEPARSEEKNGTATTTITVHARAEKGEAGQKKEKKGGAPPRATSLPAGGGVLVRLSRGEQPVRVWSDKKETPLGLLPLKEGGVLMAVSSPARVWWLDERGRTGWWDELDETAAVSALAGDGDARIAALASNPGIVELYRRDRSGKATWTSDVLDTKTRAIFGRIHAVVPSAAAGKVVVEARVGNTSEPGDGWSAWVEAPGAAGPPQVTGAAASGLDRGRFLQLRLDAEAARAGEYGIDRVAVRYQGINRPPRVTTIEALPMGVAYRPVPPPAVTSGESPIVPIPKSAEVQRALKGKSTAWRSKKVYEAGALTLRWSAQDPDGDALSYKLELCRDPGGGCERWTSLEQDLTRTFYSFDSRQLPGGVYRFRVTASDRTSNPLDQAREADAISGPVVIDHAPPVIVKVDTKDGGGGEIEILVTAEDEGGRLAGAQVSTRAGHWLPIAPVDGVIDGATERFAGRAAAPGLGGVLAVRVVDAAGNVTTWRGASR